MVNIDSQAPNKVFREFLSDGHLFKSIDLIKPEYKYKNSRFDFYIEADDKKILVEVKGVNIIALDCEVTEDSLTSSNMVGIIL